MIAPGAAETLAALALLPDLRAQAQQAAETGPTIDARRRAAGDLPYLTEAESHLTAWLHALADRPPGTALERLPVCPSNPAHGRLALWPAGSREQAWCGAWYRCTAPRCYSASLYPSRELRAHNADQAVRFVASLTPVMALLTVDTPDAAVTRLRGMTERTTPA